MMKLYGQAIRGRLVMADTVAENNDTDLPFQDRLEKCFVQVCRDFDVSVPMWIARNTSEFVNFNRTIFHSEQFIDEIKFDRLVIEMVLDEK